MTAGPVTALVPNRVTDRRTLKFLRTKKNIKHHSTYDVRSYLRLND